jgi:RNA polymerase sigma factor (sigma-70 family)
MRLLDELPEAKGLTPEREAQLAKLATESAFNELVLGSMREGFSYAKRCCRAGLPDDEIYSLTYAALQSASKNYKSSKGRFFAYAKIYIRSNISQAWKDKDVVKNSSMHEEDGNQRILVNRHLPDAYDREGYRPDENEEEEIIPWLGGSVEPEFGLIDTNERWELIKPIIENKLSHRERMVVELKYRSGFGFPKIGSLLGISRQAVESVHSRALRKVRNELMRQKKYFQP